MQKPTIVEILNARFKAEGLKSQAVGQIHDSVTVLVAKGEEDQANAIIADEHRREFEHVKKQV